MATLGTSLNQRRNILDAATLQRHLLEAEESLATRGRSAKYYLDFRSRRLPPPAAFHSEKDKEAYMKNKIEQGRLERVLQHVSVQRSVYALSAGREAYAVRLRQDRFLDGVRLARENSAKVRAGVRGQDQGIGQDQGVRGQDQGIRGQDQGVRGQDQKVRGRDQGSAITPGLDTRGGDSTNTGSQSVLPAATTSRNLQRMRSTSVIPVLPPRQHSNDAMTAPADLVLSSRSVPPEPPVRQISNLSHLSSAITRHVSMYGRSAAAAQLIQELEEMEYQRTHQRRRTLDLGKAAQREREYQLSFPTRIQHLADSVKQLNTHAMSKWELLDLQQQLDRQLATQLTA